MPDPPEYQRDYDPNPEIVAASLAPQLGSDPNTLAQGKIDMARFSVLSPKEMRFVLYATLMAETSPVWEELLTAFLNFKVSVGGRGRRDIIRMESVSKGGPAQVESEITRPNLLSRALNPNWREKQMRQMGEI